MIPTLLADHEETRADSLLWRIKGTLFQLSAENTHNLAMMGLQQWQNLGAHRPQCLIGLDILPPGSTVGAQIFLIPLDLRQA